MSPDPNAMAEQLREAERSMERAINELHKRNARIKELEIEIERLRARLVANSERIRKMEQGEL